MDRCAFLRTARAVPTNRTRGRCLEFDGYVRDENFLRRLMGALPQHSRDGMGATHHSISDYQCSSVVEGLEHESAQT
jgi:hypothetical protein